MSAEQNKDSSVAATMDRIGRAARRSGRLLARKGSEQRDAALGECAAAIREAASEIMSANERDVAAAKAGGLSGAMLDRLSLDDERVEAMASGIESIMALADPVGRVLDAWERPNGLKIERVSVPLGVIGIVYESRPNVTADAAALCIKSGNAVILRGGSESFHSSHAIYTCMRSGLEAAGIEPDVVQMIPTTDRAAVGYLLSSMAAWVDVVVPRGGKNLIRRVQEEARVPVIGHLEGICHVYLHKDANVDMARSIVVNAKMRRTGICGATETVLIDRQAAQQLLPEIVSALQEAGCEVRGDATVASLARGVIAATEADWSTEYLDAIVSIRVVDDIEQAIAHVGKYGSGHTESIVTNDQTAADQFLAEVDSAIVLHNASTQFADGGEFGMGAEIGIATGRIHARGPVGAEQLTSYKYVVRGSGQVRP